MVDIVLRATPWFWPTLAGAVVVSLVSYRRVAGSLGASPVVCLLLLISLGGVVALTLTPGIAISPTSDGACDLRIVAPLGLERMFSLGQRSLNVLLFIPVGVSIGLLPWSRSRLVIAVGALVLPFLVEGLQYALPPLGHACVAADVIDNLTGLVLGLGAGTLALLVAGAFRLLHATDASSRT